MSDLLQKPPQDETGPPTLGLPDDVTDWLKTSLGPEESVVACLFADILPKGEFGERWTFLTNKRLLTLSPNGEDGEADLEFELPLGEVEDAEVREYVGSSALIVSDQDVGHEVARFSLASYHEASDLCHCLKEVVRERKAGEPIDKVPPPPPRRPEHRCSKCGRALSRWSETCPHCVDRRQILMRLFCYLLPYRWFAALGLTLTLAITAMQLLPTYLTKVLLDGVFIEGRLGLFPVIVGVLIGVHIGSAVISMFRSYVMVWLGNRVLLDLRVKVYDHLQMLRLSYYNRRQTGRIMARVTGDLSRLQYFIAEGFQEILINLVTMILIAMILALMNWRLFFLALAPVPIIVVSTWIFGRRMHQLYHRLWRRWAGLSAILADTIPGIRVVKSFAQERREVQRFSSYSNDLFVQELQAARLWCTFFPFVNLMTALGSILIFSVGGYMVIRGNATPGTLIAFVGYLWRFYMPVQQFGRMNH
ncbi:MAG: hypothetical protein KAX19_13925, partial [Candidatus Brocadiae bacterium]|nr:hypothetical protein [Candidatus Brocadiia bacterium]